MSLQMHSLQATPIGADGVDAAAKSEARRDQLDTLATVLLTALVIAIVSVFGVAIELI